MHHQAWQRVLVILSDLKAFSHIEDAATRAAQLHLLQEALDVVLRPVLKSPQAPTSFCESLVYRLKVRGACNESERILPVQSKHVTAPHAKTGQQHQLYQESQTAHIQCSTTRQSEGPGD